MIRIPAALLLSLSLVPAGVSAQEIVARDEGLTRVLVGHYESAETWTMKALVLETLGEHWHPVASPIVLSALQDKDPRLVAFAIEALRRTRPDVLRAVATKEIVEELIDDTSKERNELVRERVLDVLSKIAPDSGNEDRGDWTSWWRKVDREYATAEWPAVEKAEGGDDEPARTTTAPILDRAMDLRENGLDLVICIDTTGSMRPPMEMTRDAISGIVALLGGLTERFRVGLVHYKDHGDMGGGADVLVELTRKADRVRDKLDKTPAAGGGDVPEAVLEGLTIALGEEPDWNLEANKLVLLIGDAPPHEETQEAILEVVRAAHENPASAAGRGPRTGKGASEKLPPFVVSTISIAPPSAPYFAEIADAGGGVAVKMYEEIDKGRFKLTGNARRIVEDVMQMSFGPRWRAQTKSFVDTWFTYRAAGFFD